MYREGGITVWDKYSSDIAWDSNDICGAINGSLGGYGCTSTRQAVGTNGSKWTVEFHIWRPASRNMLPIVSGLPRTASKTITKI